MARVEQALNSSQASLRSLEDQRERAESEFKYLELQVATGETDLSGPQLDNYLEEIEKRRERMKSEARDLEQKISELENDLTRQREEYEGWQRFVDQRLRER